MPNIKEYVNPITDLHPSEAGYAAAMVSGRRIGALNREGDAEIGRGFQNLFKPIGEYFKDQDEAAAQHEIGQGIVQRAKMEQGWADAQDEIIKTSDPNDVRAKLGEYQQNTVTPQSQAMMEGFKTKQGRAWATHAISESMAQQVKRNAVDSANASGDAVAVNLGQTLNARANSAYTTPADLDHHLQQITDDYNVVLANTPLKPAQRRSMDEMVQKARQQTANQGVMGQLDKTAGDPREIVGPLIDKYAPNLTPAQQQELRSHADTRFRANQVRAKADEVEVRRVEKDAFNQELNSVEAEVYKTPGQIRVTPEIWERTLKATQMPGATQEPGRVQSTLTFLKNELTNQQHGPLQTSPDIYQNFAGRIFLPATDPRALKVEDVYNMRSAGLLNDHDFNYFREGVNMAQKNPQLAADQKSWHAFISEHKSTFTHDSPLSTTTDPAGHSRYAQWQRDATEDFMARRAAGEKLRDIENDWIGERKIAPYLKGLSDLQQQLNRTIDQSTGRLRSDPLPPPTPITPVTKPWQPGQSGADFLKQNGQ